jgi:hypothetical protein
MGRRTLSRKINVLTISQTRPTTIAIRGAQGVRVVVVVTGG